MIVLFGGAAGAGKTTIARLWCKSRNKAVHIQLDEVRNFIISGLADPQIITDTQKQQYSDSVKGCTALARSFSDAGYDVAIDDVFEPAPTRTAWLPQLKGLDVRLVILHPPLETIFSRMANREKQVLEHHVRIQYSSIADWPLSFRIENGDLTIEQTLKEVEERLNSVGSPI